MPEAGDLVCGCDRSSRCPLKRDLAGRRRVEAGDHVEEGRLAGAVRADQADDRALRDREVDLVDRDQAAEALGDLAGLEDRPGAIAARADAAGAVVARRSPGDRRGRRRAARPCAARSGRCPSGRSSIISTSARPKISSFELTRSIWPGTARPSDRRSSRCSQPVDAVDQDEVEGAEHDPAEHHAPDVADAAQDDHRQHDDRDAEVELERVDELEHRGVERAGEARERGAQRERQQLGLDQVDAHAGGGDLVLAHRHPGAAEPRVVAAAR